MQISRSLLENYLSTLKTYYSVVSTDEPDTEVRQSTLEKIRTERRTLHIDDEQTSITSQARISFFSFHTNERQDADISSDYMIGCGKQVRWEWDAIACGSLESLNRLCATIQSALSACQRKLGQGEQDSLMRILPRDMDRNSGTFCPSGWVLLGATGAARLYEKPYTRMFRVASKRRGDNSYLLRSELLSILAVMFERMILSLRDKRIYAEERIQFPITVTFFSFLQTQGRISRARYAGRGVTIYASQLYDFSTPPKAEESTKLFLRYMCREMGE